MLHYIILLSTIGSGWWWWWGVLSTLHTYPTLPDQNNNNQNKKLPGQSKIVFGLFRTVKLPKTVCILNTSEKATMTRTNAALVWVCVHARERFAVLRPHRSDQMIFLCFDFAPSHTKFNPPQQPIWRQQVLAAMGSLFFFALLLLFATYWHTHARTRTRKVCWRVRQKGVLDGFSLSLSFLLAQVRLIYLLPLSTHITPCCVFLFPLPLVQLTCLHQCFDSVPIDSSMKKMWYWK